MFITLTSLGGDKVRINTDKVVRYSTGSEVYRLEHRDGYAAATEMVITDSRVLSVKETPEQIDEILRTSYITVYERK